MKYIFTYLLFVLSFSAIRAQTSTVPAFPTADQAVTITFNSAASSLGYYTGDLYAHTGVMIAGNESWQHVIGSWGDNSVQPKLNYEGDGIYTLSISPDVNTFYAVPSNETVTQLAFVFRTANGSQQTSDLFVSIYENSLAITLNSPTTTYFTPNQNISVSATASESASLSLKLNDTELAQISGTSISTTTTLTETGTQWLIASASLDGISVYDSLQVFVSPATVEESRPAGLKEGINYLSDTELSLVLLAPEKSAVYVLGDFNNWEASTDYQMKKDGDYFWLTINNLTPGQEYIFQYWIDGSIRIGDPYCDKISDPYDDSYIPDDIYPNLPSYPTDKTTDRASVFQTGQSPYEWQSTSWDLPAKEELVIYELLIRDFTEEGSYQAVIEKLDYLERLGVNAIEFMPFSEFEGNSSWGYNPNYYFAPDKAYGTKNDLKALIDSCHKRGMIVIQDMVLNHAYNSSPMAQMYWDEANNQPAANNPWFNQTSPNSTYSWGSDFNHESAYTQAFVDSVTSYWLSEYQLDGFRFDFTKGFTNTPGDGSAYDAARITILKRMADHIWSVKPDAFVILEHFADNSEEKELAAYEQGMLIWGNANYNFNEATMGWNENSDFSWASYQNRGYSQPGLVAYMESHDEERLMYKNISYGNAEGEYNIQNLATALDRNELGAAFFFSLSGPKMIWQFGELGYDYSIDYNDRVGEKPVKWDYLDDPDRQKLFDVYSAMLRLRQQFPVFTSGTESLSLSGALKSIQLQKDGHYITLVGNFGVEAATISAPFATTGTWYEFFSGQEYAVNASTQSISLQAGEYRLYSSQELPPFGDLATDVTDPVTNSELSITLYPNPAINQLWVDSSEKLQSIRVYGLDGKLLEQLQPESKRAEIGVANYRAGVYFVHVKTENFATTQKFVKTN